MMELGTRLLIAGLMACLLLGTCWVPAASAAGSLPLAMIRLDRMQTGVTAPMEVAFITGQNSVSRIDVTMPAAFGYAGGPAVSGSNDLGFTPLPGSLSLSRVGNTLEITGLSGLTPGTAYAFTVSSVVNPAPGQYVAAVSTLDSGGTTLETTPIGLAVNVSDQVTVSLASRSVCVNADLNHNGRVDIFDLSIVLSTYATNNPRGDINGDGVVNVFDLSRLLTCYGFVV